MDIKRKLDRLEKDKNFRMHGNPQRSRMLYINHHFEKVLREEHEPHDIGSNMMLPCVDTVRKVFLKGIEVSRKLRESERHKQLFEAMLARSQKEPEEETMQTQTTDGAVTSDSERDHEVETSCPILHNTAPIQVPVLPFSARPQKKTYRQLDDHNYSSPRCERKKPEEDKPYHPSGPMKVPRGTAAIFDDDHKSEKELSSLEKGLWSTLRSGKIVCFSDMK